MRKLSSLPFLILLIILSTLHVGVTSCTKKIIHNDTITVIKTDTVTKNQQLPPVYSIQGLWIGSYTDDGLPNQGPQYFSFSIKPEGNLAVEAHPNGTIYFATGTWTLKGDTL